MTYSSSSTLRLASSSALSTPSMGRSTGFSKMSWSSSVIGSDLVIQDIEGAVILIIVQAAEEIERRTGCKFVRITPGEKQDGRCVLGRALQVVQHVVRSDVGVDLAHAGQEYHVVRGCLDRGTDFRDQVCMGVEHPLKQLLELGLVGLTLHLEDLIKDV